MKKQKNVEIGNRIRLLRNAKGLTQDKIAEIIDVSLRVWNDTENGRQAVTIDFLLKLNKHFDISLDYILTGSMSSESDCPLVSHYNRCPENKKEKLVTAVSSWIDMIS